MTQYVRGMRINQQARNPLSELLGNDLAWVTGEALCAQSDPETWFPEKGGARTQARKLCLECPLLEPCRAYALKTQPPMGVWGDLERDRNGRLLAPGATKAVVKPGPKPPVKQRVSECGSTGGYRWHINHQEPTCAPCRAANARAQADRLARKKALEAVKKAA